MSELKIILEKEIRRDLGQRTKIEEIFNNIDSNITHVIMDFTNIEFMGRSFAQEYLNQKHCNIWSDWGKCSPRCAKDVWHNLKNKK